MGMALIVLVSILLGQGTGVDGGGGGTNPIITPGGGGGGGNVNTSSNNSFTAANTFAGPTTFNGAVTNNGRFNFGTNGFYISSSQFYNIPGDSLNVNNPSGTQILELLTNGFFFLYGLPPNNNVVELFTDATFGGVASGDPGWRFTSQGQLSHVTFEHSGIYTGGVPAYYFDAPIQATNQIDVLGNFQAIGSQPALYLEKTTSTFAAGGEWIAFMDDILSHNFSIGQNTNATANLSFRSGSTSPYSGTEEIGIVPGLTTIRNLSVSGSVTHTGAVTNSGMVVNTDGMLITSTGSMTNNGSLTASNVTIRGTLGVTGATTHSGTADFSTNITFMNGHIFGTNVTFGTYIDGLNDFEVKDSLGTTRLNLDNSTRRFTVNDALSVNSNATVNGTLTVVGASTLNGFILFQGGGTFKAGTTVTNNGTLLASNLTALTTIELGNASDTTLSRAAAGVLAVEGTNVLTTSSISTLTGKTIIDNSNVIEEITTTASSATPTPTGGSLRNLFTVTALAANATFGAPSGSPINGNLLTIRILDNGTARTLTWAAAYTAGTTVALPTTTTINKTMYVVFRYNSTGTVWNLLGVADGF